MGGQLWSSKGKQATYHVQDVSYVPKKQVWYQSPAEILLYKQEEDEK